MNALRRLFWFLATLDWHWLPARLSQIKNILALSLTALVALAVVAIVVFGRPADVASAWHGNASGNCDPTTGHWWLSISAEPPQGAHWSATPGTEGWFALGDSGFDWRVDFWWDGSEDTDSESGRIENCLIPPTEEPTETPSPIPPTNTSVPSPTATNTPDPTATPTEAPTNTPAPTATPNGAVTYNACALPGGWWEIYTWLIINESTYKACSEAGVCTTEQSECQAPTATPTFTPLPPATQQPAPERASAPEAVALAAPLWVESGVPASVEAIAEREYRQPYIRTAARVAGTEILLWDASLSHWIAMKATESVFVPAVRMLAIHANVFSQLGESMTIEAGPFVFEFRKISGWNNVLPKDVVSTLLRMRGTVFTVTCTGADYEFRQLNGWALHEVRLR